MLATTISPRLQADDAAIARLFFTPQERARLDEIRYSGVDLLDKPIVNSELTTRTVTLSGIIEKRNGELRAWLNGQSLDSGDLDIPVRVGRQLTAEQQLPLLLPGGLIATPKVGQVVNLSTGDLTEGYLQPTHTSAETVATEPGASKSDVNEAEPD